MRFRFNFEDEQDLIIDSRDLWAHQVFFVQNSKDKDWSVIVRTKPRDDGKETYFFRRIRQIARVHLKIFYNNLIKIRSLPDMQWSRDQIFKDSESKALHRSESTNSILYTHAKLRKKMGWSLKLKHLRKAIRERREDSWCDASHQDLGCQNLLHAKRWDAHS